jgi:lipoyl(octanoyl) transferase
VSLLGLALYVNTDLAYFELITPCGIRQRGVTSMQRELGSPLSMQAVKESFVRHFCEVFNLQVINGSIS